MDLYCRCLLIGCGNIGFRYLQGINNINKRIDIYVVDKSKEAISNANILLNKCALNPLISIKYFNDISDFQEEFDLAIIATTALARVKIIEEILNKFKVKSWILEKVLAQSEKDLLKMQQFFKNNQNVWVNHPRRLMDFHKIIKKNFSEKNYTSLDVYVRGSEWGLACNAIHFIDLVSWWTKEYIKDFDASNLLNWVESKRKGFEEVYGNLSFSFDNGSNLHLMCDKGVNIFHKVEIITRDGLWEIDELNGNFVLPNKDVISGELDYLSSIVPYMFSQIIEENKCDLTNLDESINSHIKLINALTNHRKSNIKEKFINLPIT